MGRTFNDRNISISDHHLNELRNVRESIDRLLATGGRLPDCFAVNLNDCIVYAQQELHLRDSRREVFDGDLFADPAWDLLLDLFVSDAQHRNTKVSAALHGARVPLTTGLRWLALLEKRGLVERRDDPLDRRRIFVSLSADGFTSMRLLLEKNVKAKLTA